METSSHSRSSIPQKQVKDDLYKLKIKLEKNFPLLNWDVNKNEQKEVKVVGCNFQEMMNIIFSAINEEVQYLQDYFNIFKNVPNIHQYYTNKISSFVKIFNAIRDRMFLQDNCTMFDKSDSATQELLNFIESFKAAKNKMKKIFAMALKSMFNSQKAFDGLTDALQEVVEEELKVSKDLQITITNLREFDKINSQDAELDSLRQAKNFLKNWEGQKEEVDSWSSITSTQIDYSNLESDFSDAISIESDNSENELESFAHWNYGGSLNYTLGEDSAPQNTLLATNSEPNEKVNTYPIAENIQLSTKNDIDCKSIIYDIHSQVSDFKIEIITGLNKRLDLLLYEIYGNFKRHQHCYIDNLVCNIPCKRILEIFNENDWLNNEVGDYTKDPNVKSLINENELRENLTKYDENINNLKNHKIKVQESKYVELIKETEMLKQYYEKSVMHIINVLHIKTKAVIEENRQRAATDHIETRNKSIDALSRYIQTTTKHLHYNRLIGQNLIIDSVNYHNLKIVLDNSNTKLESIQHQLHNANATITNENDKELNEYLTQIQYDLENITDIMQNKVINAVTVSKVYITNMEKEIFQNHLKFVENIISIEENSIKKLELLITGLVKGHSLVPFPILFKTEEPLKNSKDKLINLHQYIKKANDNNQHSNKSNEDFAKVNESLMDYLKHKSEADSTIQLHFMDTINQFSKRYLLNQLRTINQNFVELEFHISTKYSLIKELEIDVILDSDTQKSMVLPEALTTTAECKLMEAVNKWKVRLAEYYTKLTKLIDMKLDDDILKQAKTTCNTFLTQATKFKISLDAAFERSLKKQFTELTQTVSKQKTKINELQENINGAFAVLDPFYKELNSPGFLSKVGFVLWSYVSSKNEKPLAKRLQNIVLFTNNAIGKLKTLENEILRTSGSIASLQAEKLDAQQNFSNKEAQYKELLDEKCKLIERLQQDHDNLMETSTKQNEIQRLSIIEKEETIVTQGAKLEKLQEQLQTTQIEYEKSCQIVEESKTKIKDLEDSIFTYKQELIKSAKAIEVIKNASAKYSDTIHTESIRLLKSLKKITS